MRTIRNIYYSFFHLDVFLSSTEELIDDKDLLIHSNEESTLGVSHKYCLFLNLSMVQ